MLCHVPDATRSPSSDIGVRVMSACKRTRNTGISASVRKKFQCTPYSVTCFHFHRQPCTQLEKKTDLDDSPDIVYPSLARHGAPPKGYKRVKRKNARMIPHRSRTWLACGDSGKHREVNCEDREHRHEHHMCAVGAQCGQTRRLGLLS